MATKNISKVFPPSCCIYMNTNLVCNALYYIFWIQKIKWKCVHSFNNLFIFIKCCHNRAFFHWFMQDCINWFDIAPLCSMDGCYILSNGYFLRILYIFYMYYHFVYLGLKNCFRKLCLAYMYAVHVWLAKAILRLTWFFVARKKVMLAENHVMQVLH